MSDITTTYGNEESARMTAQIYKRYMFYFYKINKRKQFGEQLPV